MPAAIHAFWHANTRAFATTYAFVHNGLVAVGLDGTESAGETQRQERRGGGGKVGKRLTPDADPEADTQPDNRKERRG